MQIFTEKGLNPGPDDSSETNIAHLHMLLNMYIIKRSSGEEVAKANLYAYAVSPDNHC